MAIWYFLELAPLPFEWSFTLASSRIPAVWMPRLRVLTRFLDELVSLLDKLRTNGFPSWHIYIYNIPGNRSCYKKLQLETVAALHSKNPATVEKLQLLLVVVPHSSAPTKKWAWEGCIAHGHLLALCEGCILDLQLNEFSFV